MSLYNHGFVLAGEVDHKDLPGEYIVKGCEVNVLLSLVSSKDWREW